MFQNKIMDFVCGTRLSSREMPSMIMVYGSNRTANIKKGDMIGIITNKAQYIEGEITHILSLDGEPGVEVNGENYKISDLQFLMVEK